MQKQFVNQTRFAFGLLKLGELFIYSEAGNYDPASSEGQCHK
jgi:hypothetical protein